MWCHRNLTHRRCYKQLRQQQQPVPENQQRQQEQYHQRSTVGHMAYVSTRVMSARPEPKVTTKRQQPRIRRGGSTKKSKFLGRPGGKQARGGQNWGGGASRSIDPEDKEACKAVKQNEVIAETQLSFVTINSLAPTTNNSLNTSSSSGSQHLANADTRTTGHYMSFADLAYLKDVQCINEQDDQVIQASHSATLDLPSLPNAARKAYLFSALVCSLMSIGLLCNQGMTAVFDQEKVTIRNGQNHVVLQGARQHQTGLWMMDLNKDNQPAALYAAPAVQLYSMEEKVNFLHAALGYPVKSTLLKALKQGFLTGFPILTATNVRRHLCSQEATAMGHLDQERQEQRSTKRQLSEDEEHDSSSDSNG